MLPCQWIHQVCNLPRAPEHAKLHDRIDTHIRRPRRIKHPRRPIQRIPSPRTCLLPHPPQPIHHRMVQEETLDPAPTKTHRPSSGPAQHGPRHARPTGPAVLGSSTARNSWIVCAARIRCTAAAPANRCSGRTLKLRSRQRGLYRKADGSSGRYSSSRSWTFSGPIGGERMGRTRRSHRSDPALRGIAPSGGLQGGTVDRTARRCSSRRSTCVKALLSSQSCSSVDSITYHSRRTRRLRSVQGRAGDATTPT